MSEAHQQIRDKNAHAADDGDDGEIFRFERNEDGNGKSDRGGDDISTRGIKRGGERHGREDGIRNIMQKRIDERIFNLFTHKRKGKCADQIRGA